MCSVSQIHDDVIKWKHFPRYWPFVTGELPAHRPVTGELPAQGPVTRSFDFFFDLRLNKCFSKQSWGWWFETLSRPLWRHCNILCFVVVLVQVHEGMKASGNCFDSMVHGADLGHIWGRQDAGGTHVGPVDFVIWVITPHRCCGMQLLGPALDTCCHCPNASEATVKGLGE